MSNQHLKVRKGLNLTPQSVEPTNPVEGAMYFDVVVGLRLRKNGVWQTAGGQGEVKVALVDRSATSLPLIAGGIIDGEVILDGDKVLFSNLSIDNNRVYRASISGGAISWSAQPDFAGQFDPAQADVVRVIKGTVYCKSQFIFQGSVWLWGMINIDQKELGSAAESWSSAHIDSLIGKTVAITTDSTNGDAVISGTESLIISASGGLNVNSGVTQTKSVFQLTQVTDISQLFSDANLGGDIGQSFTPTQNGKLKEVKLDLGISGTGSVVVDIYADGSGVPTGPILQTSAPIAAPVSQGSLTSFIFDGTFDLVAATKYHFVINLVSLSGSVSVKGSLGGNVYTGGTFIFSTDGGVTWNNNAFRDLLFEVDLLANSSTANPNIKLNAATSGSVGLGTPATVTDYNLLLPDAQGTLGQFMSNDGLGGLSWSDPVIGFSSWTVINSNITASVFNDLGVETNLNTVDITLPATPINGAKIRVIDRLGTFSTNSCFIKTTDGSTISNQAQPLEIDVSYIWAEFLYDSAANNWVIYGPLADDSLSHWGTKTKTSANNGDVILERDQALIDSTGGVFGLVLPPITKDGMSVRFLDAASNNDINNVTITPDGANTINGAATLVLNIKNGHVELVSSGTNWIVLGLYS